MILHTFFTRTPSVPPPFEAVYKEIGTNVEFHGLVRELEHGHPLAGLHYETYEPMALKQTARIFTLRLEAHPVPGVTWIHAWAGCRSAKPQSSSWSSRHTEPKP